jgi:pilus assembly protein CpaC
MMPRKFLQPLFVIAGFAAIFGFSVIAVAATEGMNRLVQVTAGKADTVTLPGAVSDVLVANPLVADVGTLRANRLYIVGKAIGDTNVLAFDDVGNQLANITVRVRADEQSLKDSVREFFPDEKIEVRTVRDEVVITGRVSTPSVANQVRDLASRFVTGQDKKIIDLMAVEGEQQVMLKVRVIEARRSALREYGINTDYRTGLTTGGGLSTTPFGTGTITVSPGNFGPLSVTLQGLERDGLVNTLAEPNLTAISGESAGFLAGGEFPVPTGRDQDGNVTLEFKQFGVSLNFTPTVLSSDRISLQLATEVSTKSEEDGVTLQGLTIPGLAVRRADTTVQVGSGGTIMMAGLIKSDTLDNLNSIPGIRDVPVLGDLFKSKSFARNETELLILVTPYVVKPYAEAEGVAVPVTESSYPLPVKTPVYMPQPAGGAPVAPSVKKSAAAVPATERGAVLNAALARNMHAVYGSKAPSRAAGGYIVD